MVVGILAFSAVPGALFPSACRRLCRERLRVRSRDRQGMGSKRYFSFSFSAVAHGRYWWSRREKIVISATGDALTVKKRPGEV